MLDYLKQGSNIIIILLFAVTCYAGLSTMDDRPVVVMDDAYLKSTLNKIGEYTENHEWDFKTKKFDKEINDVKKILKSNNIKEKDYYMTFIKFLAEIEYENRTDEFFIISVNVYLRGVHNSWSGKWILIEGSNEILEEIKIEDYPTSEK